MRIAVNTRLLQENKLEGIGRFACETLKRIVANHPEHEFYFIFDRPFSESFVFAPNVKPVVVGPMARHPLLFYYWFEVKIPAILKKIKADVFISPDGYLSLSSEVNSLAVIHDLNFEHYPKFLPWHIAWYYQYFFPRFAAKAKALVTVSKYSAQDISKRYGISNGSIDVVYNGVDDSFRPVSDETQLNVRRHYSDGKPFFLYVGSVNKRKNIQSMLEAYESYRVSGFGEEKFLLAGSMMWKDASLKKALKGFRYKDDIIFLGRVPDADLPALVASAWTLVFVPFFEGFGIPVIEAFASGVPVIASNSSSIPEISEGAAYLIDPERTETIKYAMMELKTNNGLRDELIEKGLKRADAFKWEAAAVKLWNSISKILPAD